MERTMISNAGVHLMPRDLSERALVKRCQEGDTSAFKVLVERYQQRAMRLACSFVRSQDDSRDVVQDAFVRVFKSIREFRNESQFYTWFCRMLMNVALDLLRRNKTPTESYEDGLLQHSQIASEVQIQVDPVHLRTSGRSRVARRSAVGSTRFPWTIAWRSFFVRSGSLLRRDRSVRPVPIEP
jgi:DNA-directed RNA polymerase specialized sigma24 family protein